jgi:hypothetical protein
MKKTNVHMPVQYVAESAYRQIEGIKDTYKFPSIEYTVNVIMDFVGNHQIDGSFEDYIKKQFPSKF